MWKIYSLLFSVFTGLIPTGLFGKKISSAHKKRKQQSREKADFQNPILIHCASYGEYEQGKPFIELLSHLYPLTPLLLTFSSPSGFDAHRENTLVDNVLYLPWDTLHTVDAFLDKWKPKAVFHIKYEYWPIWILALHSRKIPLGIVSALFTKTPPIWQRGILHKISHFMVQDEHSKNILQSIDIRQVSIVGDTRMLQVLTNASTPWDIPEVLKNTTKQIIVAGSVWKEDMPWIVQSTRGDNSLITLICPHELHEDNVEAIAKYLKPEEYEYWESKQPPLTLEKPYLIIREMGLLKYLYRVANAAYIGGGFGKGIHNTLEPAVYNIPIVCGPNISGFLEAEHFKNQGILHIAQKKNMNSLWGDILQNTSLEKTRVLCRKYFQENNTKERIARVLTQNKLFKPLH